MGRSRWLTAPMCVVYVGQHHGGPRYARSPSLSRTKRTTVGRCRKLHSDRIAHTRHTSSRQISSPKLKSARREKQTFVCPNVLHGPPSVFRVTWQHKSNGTRFRHFYEPVSCGGTIQPAGCRRSECAQGFQSPPAAGASNAVLQNRLKCVHGPTARPDARDNESNQ